MSISHLFEEMGLSAPVMRVKLMGASDQEMEGISREMAIGLSLDEMKRVQEYFAKEGRDPRDIELEALGQAWSEHCCYKSSKYIMKQNFMNRSFPQALITSEDAGVVEFDDDHAYVVGLESHNHPSAIGPYGGSATGVGGIIRDVVCMGAQPIAVIDPLFFGSLDAREEEIPEGINHPKYIFSGVVAGIRDYGNRIGIPTVAGSVNFHRGYTGNPLVNVGAVGIAKKKHIIRSRVGGPGEIYILAGGRTGRDGIHGVTFASADLSSDSEEKDRGSVQLGDPIVKEPIIHSCLEANEMGLLRGMKDLGGGGLSCVSGEMALDGGCGAIIHLDRIPLKEEGLKPWEIWVSESQERMMVSVLPRDVDAVMHIFKKWDVEAVIIGEVVPEKHVKALWEGEEILNMDLDFFTAGPEYCRVTLPREVSREILEADIPLPDRGELEASLLVLMEDPNICSREMVFRTYDHEVRARTVVKPYVGDPFSPGPSDAAVLKPLEDSWKGIAITTDVNPGMCEIDPYRGTLSALDESIRNLVSVGARPHSLTDCLNFGNPERPHVMWEFKEVVAGLSEACIAFDTPVTGGNVSFYNETKGEGIFPTPTIGMVGLIEDIDNRIPSQFQHPGDSIILIGRLTGEVGGSEYLKQKTGKIQGKCPEIRLSETADIIRFMGECSNENILSSANDASEGGIAVALAECCFGEPATGCQIDLLSGKIRSDFLLFGESQNIMVLSCPPETAETVLELAESHGLMASTVGKVTSNTFEIAIDGNTAISQSTGKLKQTWDTALEDQLR
ncbi:MAG: phosphoribosylformylglycinamidine synthase subunit PurL [Thermoplasmata archaeon]|nr:phosphoribosylformylglycinamidine synthase subunit PurL [Thermoplasmata archaeon]